MKIRVKSCPFCEIFEEPKKQKISKLYYPKLSSIKEKDDFVIIDSKYYETPVVVVSEHIPGIGKEQWGRILHTCRVLFGGAIRLNLNRKRIKDHWHASIKKRTINRDPNKLEDLKDE